MLHSILSYSSIGNIDIRSQYGFPLKSNISVINPSWLKDIQLGTILFLPSRAVLPSSYGLADGKTVYEATDHVDFYNCAFYPDLNVIDNATYTKYMEHYVAGGFEEVPTLQVPDTFMKEADTYPWKVTSIEGYYSSGTNTRYRAFMDGTAAYNPVDRGAWLMVESDPAAQLFFRLKRYSMTVAASGRWVWQIYAQKLDGSWVQVDSRSQEVTSGTTYEYNVSSEGLYSSFLITFNNVNGVNPVITRLQYWCSQPPFFCLPDLQYLAPTGFKTCIFIG